MILPLHTNGWDTDSLRAAKVILSLNLVLFTKDTEGNFQKVASAEGIQTTTPLFIELEMFMDAYALAQHFDVMVREGIGQGMCVFLDSKGGRFRQR